MAQIPGEVIKANPIMRRRRGSHMEPVEEENASIGWDVHFPTTGIAGIHFRRATTMIKNPNQFAQ
jgi:hypothetical protein